MNTEEGALPDSENQPYTPPEQPKPTPDPERTLSRFLSSAVHEKTLRLLEDIKRWFADRKVKDRSDPAPPQRVNPRVYEMRRSLSPDYSMRVRDNAHIMKMEVSEKTLSVLALTASVAALVIALEAERYGDRNVATNARENDRALAGYTEESQKLAQQVRQLQIQVMDQNALMIREGLAQPTDEVYGPAGNLEYKPHKTRRKRKWAD